ncbi:succinate dehydrogenase/fumarate reductase iron-sulfur subunit [bacterium BMS3Abin02]|nr:succinate dehydrogenase/fumarate reductase iron-sulfur subunit [bacterium BMS3Abin02]GBE22125.1 succinate dehydrogenase/fumarate reductase iron-sulfur subunit [bacterium BMS3Bbin01]
MEPRRRPTASRVLGALAVVTFLATLFLWWLGTLPGHFVPAVGRVIFGDIPDALIAVFYVGVAAFLALSIHLFSLRARNWERGAFERRWGQWKERVLALDSGLRMRTLLEERTAGWMHAMIYWGFVVLFLGTVILEIDHLLPMSLKFLQGGFYQGYSAVLDVAGVVFVTGVLWAAVRRYGQRPWRLRSKTRDEDAWILFTLAMIGITGLLVEAARISLSGRPSFETWSIVGYPLSFLFPAAVAQAWHRALWVLHVVSFVGFVVLLPTTKLRHMLVSPANMALSPRERTKGAMREMPNLMEVEDIETVGASVVADFTWKQLLDTDACTVCGRCMSVCPANVTGKPLDPREIILKLGQVATVTGCPVVSPTVMADAAITITADNVFERISAEEVWTCTTCRACDEVCPVNIEIVDKILDMRRYLTLMESDFPSELGKTYLALENQGNPWGMGRQDRAAWTRQLDFDVKILGEDGVESAEYLYWVGCAGSFDDRNQKVTVATARLLHEAGVDFAILGPREKCSGDPARRSGNEYVFQQLALENIETMNDSRVRKIITQCPHCFNTLKNEYPQFGGDYELIHHSELLSALVEEGRLSPEPSDGKKITYHDPCYLGRYNDVYEAPRSVVGTGLVEMERSESSSFCCGAGGAQFWMEDRVGKKVNIERAQEAIATGAEEVAVACPFCFIMMDDGVKELGKEIPVKDIAQILSERIFPGK